MSQETIITIGRQYGSGGREIGVQLAKELGLRANAFYADSEVEFAGLYDLGVPGIMTNAPARLVKWLELQK